jgi:hypothetical protein
MLAVQPQNGSQWPQNGSVGFQQPMVESKISGAEHCGQQDSQRVGREAGHSRANEQGPVIREPAVIGLVQGMGYAIGGSAHR